MYVLFQALSVESFTVFDKSVSCTQKAHIMHTFFSSLKYVQFYDELLGFSNVDGSLKFKNVLNF